MHNKKLILDACCGGRMFWFNKQHPNTIYIDIRREEKGCLKVRPNFCVEPDLIMDFKCLDFPNNYFKLIVFDPPQMFSLGVSSILRKKYGVLNRETWKQDLTKGFNELWRVLAVHGTLVFKWNAKEIPLKDVLSCFKKKPLFGHPTAKRGTTIWCIFFKTGPGPEKAYNRA